MLTVLLRNDALLREPFGASVYGTVPERVRQAGANFLSAGCNAIVKAEGFAS